MSAGAATPHPSRVALPLAVAIAVAVPLLGLRVRGVRPAGDTSRYVEGAQALLAGDGVPPDALPYSGYVVVVAATRSIGLSQTAVIVLQIICAAAAVVAVHHTARSLAGPRAGALAALGLSLNADLWTWHLYVLTDSLYITAVAAASWLLHRALEQDSVSSWMAALAATAVMVSLRPNGWVVLAVFAAYVAWRLLPRGRLVGALAVLLLVVAAAAQAPPLQADDNVQAAKMLREGVVNWGDRSTSRSMPGDVAAVQDVRTALAYAAQEPVAVLQLAGARAGTELAHVRSYYSSIHNAGIVAFLLPLYTMALVGAWSQRRHPLTWLLTLVAGVHLLIVAGTFADYDGRFLLYSVPALTVLAGCGADRTLAGLAQAARRVRGGARPVPRA